MNFKLFSILFLMVGAVSFFGQAPVIKDNTNPNKPAEPYKVDDVRGNIKRRAIYLPKPIFPREALEAGADGTVKVEIVLGADGRVVSAKAVSGHPLLYRTAEEAARQTVFRRLETTDPNATETGILTYSFSIEKDNWVRIGFILTSIQKIPTLRGLIVPRVAKAFQKDWTEEHEMLAKLAEMRRVEIETDNNNPATTGRPGLIRSPAVTNGTPQATLKSEMRVQVPIPNPPTPERIALAQNLSASLQSRLGNEDANLWLFNTGVNLAKASELLRNPNDWRSAASLLRQSLDSAPASASAEVRQALVSLIGIFEGDRRTIETRNEIGIHMSTIFNVK